MQRLDLLNLPDDILQAIVKEVTHTNDLTNMALANSTMHDLVIPHIYSRFDIVWPDTNTALDSRMGVDALTYGLATLVMAHDVFGEKPGLKRARRRIRRGNLFAQYTKKFSIGNGPADWVQDYAITKEAGKMLGTLVALAIGRMRNLESLYWDMGTGVLRDVWLALASLADREDGQDCRLERIWVRWHDNSEGSPLGGHASTTNQPEIHGPSPSLPGMLPMSSTSLFQIPPYPRVEFPTFSVLPPIKSLTVLDIDELPYVEEMSVLIETSMSELRELRVGVAHHAQFDPWVRPAEDKTYVSSATDPAPDMISRPGGILGILLARIIASDAFSAPRNGSTSPLTDILTAASQTHANVTKPHFTVSTHMNTVVTAAMTDGFKDDRRSESVEMEEMTTFFAHQDLDPLSNASDSFIADSFADVHNETRVKLKLEVLELERIPLSVIALSRTIDWTRLSILTLLGCRNHENLWKALRKRFAPSNHSRSSSFSLFKSPTKDASVSTTRIPPSSSSRSTLADASSFALQIRQLHTDTVSPSLLSFIHTTLAPDSLTHLFLQECSSYKSPVTIESIYKMAVRRHRGSLRKLLIDSSLRTDGPQSPSDPADRNWRRWVYNRELLAAITSEKMHLRELSLSVDYKDWHYFLQRLPGAKELRSLHIAHVTENSHLRIDAKEAALQVLDVIALKPEIEVCYLAVAAKCFEVLEYDSKKGSKIPDYISDHPTSTSAHHASDADVESDDDVHGTVNGHGPSHSQSISEDADESDVEDSLSGTESTDEDDGAEEDANRNGKLKTFRLREILFYDDKVSIFKARHGRL